MEHAEHGNPGGHRSCSHGQRDLRLPRTAAKGEFARASKHPPGLRQCIES